VVVLDPGYAASHEHNQVVIDGTALLDQAQREHQVTLVGPLPGNHSAQERAATGFSRDAFPRHLHELQTRNRAEQNDPAWQRTYSARSGVEGTVNEAVNGHGARCCRYRGERKTHLQHLFTAIAINVERLAALEAGNTARPATRFQQYLLAHGHPLPSWYHDPG
jgi:hypothetical protein